MLFFFFEKEPHLNVGEFYELAAVAAERQTIGFFSSTWHFPLLQVEVKNHLIAIHFAC